MNGNILQKITGFIFKYIWVFCVFLIIMEIFSTTFSANVLMKQTAQGMMQSAAGEISGRVDGVVRLLTALSHDDRFSDTSTPLYDRAMLAKPYKEAYNLFMIAICDENVNVVSTNQKSPPKELSSLAHRDYMQKLYNTGKIQITDAFPASTDGVTMNYTVAVPIMKDNDVEGCLFGSIYFDDIEEILDQNTYDGSRGFYLLSSENKFMRKSRSQLYGKDFLELASDTKFFGKSGEAITEEWLKGKTNSFWSWGKSGLCYTTSMCIEPTNWQLLYKVEYTSIIASLLPAMLIKIGFYILLCAMIFIFGRRYLKRQLSAASHLLDRMTVLQREFSQTEQTEPDYDNLFELTQKGLTDQLTGLCTRSVLFSRMQQFIDSGSSHGAVLFLDLDDLKRINDNYGHEAGDEALVHFAGVLKQYEKKYNGIASRYGGDEFILLLDNITEKTIAPIADSICNDLRATISIRDYKIPIHGSIGVVLYPKQGDKAEDLICKADLALYSAKQHGKNRYDVYTEDVSALTFK